MQTVIFIILALAASCSYLFAARQSLQHTLSVGQNPSVWLALALHAVAIGLAARASGSHLSVALAFSVVVGLSALILCLLDRVTTLRPLTTTIFPLAAIAVLTLTVAPLGHGASAPQGWRIALHAALSMFAAALLTLAAAQAIALELLDRMLHQPSQLTRVLKMPSMQASEQWLFQLIAAGFGALTLALFSGFFFVQDLFAQHLAHKTVLSLVAWATFAALLLGRWFRGWRGKQAVRWALSGYTVLLLAYFGSKLVLEHFLGRQWVG